MKKSLILFMMLLGCVSCKMDTDDYRDLKDSDGIAGFSDYVMHHYVDWTVSAIDGSEVMDHFRSSHYEAAKSSEFGDIVQTSSSCDTTFDYWGIGRFERTADGWIVSKSGRHSEIIVKVSKSDDSTWVATALPNDDNHDFSLDMKVTAVSLPKSDIFSYRHAWVVDVSGIRYEGGGFLAKFSTTDMYFIWGSRYDLFSIRYGFEHNGSFDLSMLKNNEILGTCKALYRGEGSLVEYHTSEGDILQ